MLFIYNLQELEKFVMECLSTASKNKCSSIAFPAMGTGKLRYPADLVAKSLYKCVEEFSSQNPKSVITEVLFVVYDKDHDTVKVCYLLISYVYDRHLNS